MRMERELEDSSWTELWKPVDVIKERTLVRIREEQAGAKNMQEHGDVRFHHNFNISCLTSNRANAV